MTWWPSGKVLYVGISDTPAWVVAQANTLADLRGWSRFVGLQIRYSLADRAAERDLLPMARSLDIAVTPWSVLGAGVLTGKYKPGDAGTGGRAARWDKTDRDLAIAAEVAAVADEIGRTAVAGRHQLGAPAARRDHPAHRREDRDPTER